MHTSQGPNDPKAKIFGQEAPSMILVCLKVNIFLLWKCFLIGIANLWKNEVLWNLANWKQSPSPTLSSRLENRGVDSLWDGTSAARSCGDQKGVLRCCKMFKVLYNNCKIIRFYKILKTANKNPLSHFSSKELRRPERCFITVFQHLEHHICSLEEKKN